MRHLLPDIRYALRQFARRPGTTLAILFVLTIGMTVAASLFSFVRSYNTAPAPGITPAEDLVLLRGMLSAPEGLYQRDFSREELRGQAAATSIFSAVAGWTMGTVAVDRPGADETDWLKATFVTDGYFEVQGMQPVAGAGLSASAAEGSLIAVISQGLREQHFASDEAALGQTLMVSNRPVTIVGVAPPKFRGVEASEFRALFLPEAALPALLPKSDKAYFGGFARLAPGVTLAAASEAAQAITVNATRAEAAADPRQVRLTDVVPMATMRGYPEYESEVVPMLTTLSLLGLLVLVVTGMNASALQTGIAMTRGREIATRVSLGASRRRVLRQLLVESGLLGLIAGAATAALLLVVERTLLATVNMPFALSFDRTSIAFALGVGMLAGVGAGLSPAVFAARGDVVSGLKASGGANSTRRGRLQRGLVVAQILLTQPLVVMLTAMVLLLAGEYQRQAVTEAAHEVAAVKMLVADVDAAQADVVVETERLARTLESLPSVVRAIHDPESSIDLFGYTADTASPVPPLELDAQYVAPGWFDTTGLALRAGREFTEPEALPLDSRQERAVVIGEDLAAALWPGESPIGKRLTPPPESTTDASLLVVGVAHTPPSKAQRGGSPFVVYLPAPAGAARVALLVKLRGDTETALGEIRAALRQAAPGLGVVELRTLSAIDREVRGQFLKATSIFAGLGLLALLISAIGLYAVVAFAVSQRLGEIAVRLAIGARAGQVVLRTMRDGLRLVTLGLVLGLPASLAGLALVTGTTHMLPPVPLWQVGALAMLGIATIAGLATWIPARSAARVDPANYLRGD